ncbi:cyclopropane-fatty-acyl-phospholipid synthase [Liquorilactobacillus sucicola DSM 21376 = JCM 15457]|uniref:DUF7884 domain-containing protein n=1 Tax=Liquorilactobacillus sucicola DSM 21376 = JCM 15457 TaxID=1423806 RepID=A0A023CV92_9LACO|nr:cyclopropane-fatty-acyl-phospholipid synthase family protein [Liquorilactobacillus sucicola]KRN05619.1 hypothetical protein FD15_GL002182 [Liquorilactobacillus sucicola DSM 21376 = JCM 15457]GAJ25704.1 cyclopropane-fatty-acyl-phospholipid synthase [Liquorilactobacillus sucicola DSM 21376 = JCM 15457]
MLEKTFYKTLLKHAFNIPVEVTFWDGSVEHFGPAGQPQNKIVINKPLPPQSVLEHATLTLAEAYMEKDIEVEGSIQNLITSIFMTPHSFINSSKFKKFLPKQNHSKKQSMNDIQSHYDLGNDFYKLWLDKTMTYSCAYFKTKDDSLEQAQLNKVYHILNKLDLKHNKTLLDIGCGWGTLLFAAAKDFGVQATGITLSEEQFNYVSKKIKKENLEGMVAVKLMDYRELNQSFDYITSVGMFEHVGKENLGMYFKKIAELLKPEGRALIHGITGQHMGIGSDPFINKYIFPGGYIPHLSEIMEHIMLSNLQLKDLETLRRHYQKTLEIWTQNIFKHKTEITNLFDDKFFRMWNLYLQACAASFEAGNIDVAQYLLTKGPSGVHLPLTRDYITESDKTIPTFK